MDDFVGFDWDDGNREKCTKHGVSIVEIESVFDAPVVVIPDIAHSLTEKRKRIIGRAAAAAMFSSSSLSGSARPTSTSARSAHATCIARR
ncbi:MAG: BrnT family toxin [Bauldia sp.]